MTDARPLTLLLAALIGLGVPASIVAAPVAAAPVGALPAGSEVSEAIAAVEAAQAAAWNARDAHGYAALFTVDADVVNVVDGWWKGRDEIEAKLARAFASVFAASRLTIDDVAVRRLSPDLVVAQVTWSMSGARRVDGSAGPDLQRGVQTQVVRRESGRWSIVALQTTAAVPDAAFAVGESIVVAPAARTVVPPSARAASAGAPPPALRPAVAGRCLVGTAGGSCWLREKAAKPAR